MLVRLPSQMRRLAYLFLATVGQQGPTETSVCGFVS